MLNIASHQQLHRSYPTNQYSSFPACDTKIAKEKLKKAFGFPLIPPWATDNMGRIKMVVDLLICNEWFFR